MAGNEGRVEVSFGSGDSATIDTEAEGVKFSSDATVTTLDSEDLKARKDATKEDATEAVDETTAEEGTEEKKEDTDIPFADLKVIEKFDPADPENTAAWDEEYGFKDGEFNSLERFQKEFSRNMASGKQELDENTYAYLKSRGIGRAMVDQYAADRLNALAYQEGNAEKADMEVFTHAGSVLETSATGPDILKEALGWAKGSYTEKQQSAFDAVMDKSDLDARKEAVELLLVRYGKTEAFQKAEAARKAASKPTEQRRDATKGRGTPNASPAKPFASLAEYRAERTKAEDRGDMEALKRINERRKASKF